MVSYVSTLFFHVSLGDLLLFLLIGSSRFECCGTEVILTEGTSYLVDGDFSGSSDAIHFGVSAVRFSATFKTF